MTKTTETAWPVSEADWRTAVDKALKGADFARLQSETADGLPIEPLYRPGHGAAIRRDPAPWTIVQRAEQSDPEAANAQALEDLAGGAGGLELVFETSPTARFGGLPFDDDAIERLLEDVMLDLIDIRIDAGAEADRAIALIERLAGKRGLDPASLTLRGGGDAAALAALGIDCTARNRTADGRIWHAAGATPAQELALVLAGTVDNWRAGGTAQPPAEIALVAEPDQFATIAKMRAARLLHARLAEAAGAEAAPLHLHAETSWRDLTRHDAHVNMLRTTTAALAAGIAGADSVTVLPFTAAIGLPDAFARRIARNTQSILLEESHLAAVADPSAGSGTFEAMTGDLAERSWELFREIEAAGGAPAAVRAGLPQKWLAAASDARRQAVATRSTAMIGTSLFPNLGEKWPEVLSADPAGGLPAAATVTLARTAEPFEKLRARAEALADRGTATEVFLAPLGSLAGFSDRAAFARGLFEAGGLAAPAPTAAMTAEEAAESFRRSGARIACLVGSDEAYAEAGELRDALTAAGACRVLIAARPSTAPDGFAAEACVHLKTDAVALLSDLLDDLA